MMSSKTEGRENGRLGRGKGRKEKGRGDLRKTRKITEFSSSYETLSARYLSGF